jgi:hypothetical protein
MTSITTTETVEPAYQGEFDGLCGIYAIINAIRLLCPEVDEGTAKQLFKRLLATLHKRETDPVAPVWRGMRMLTLKRLAKEAKRFMRAECGIKLKARRWEREERETITNVAIFWKRLEQELSRQRVPIIGFGGKIQHWSVAQGLTPKLMKLCDSSDMTAVRRKGCRLPIKGRGFDSNRYLLFASQILFIERTRAKGKQEGKEGRHA